MVHVSIIIVHYNGDEETTACLESLSHIERKNFTVSTYVVDNGSKVPLEIAEQYLSNWVTLIRSDANLGFTSGNNLGIQQAYEKSSPDYILLLNNDTTVAPDFLRQMLACAQAQDKPVVVTPKIYFSEHREYHRQSYHKDQLGHVLWYAGGAIDWRNLDAFHRGVDEVDYGQFDHQRESDFATGCCALFPRVILDEVGLFYPKYFLYLEDVDLSMRARLKGYRISFCADAKIWHKNAGSSGGAGSVLHQYYQTRNRLFFFFKYGQVQTRWTVLKYAAKLLFTGTSSERRATMDWMLSRMGKQAVL